jgi:hypothetical protein
MKRVSYWRKAHKRHSVRALLTGAAVSAAGAAWAALPGALVDRMPMWLVLSVPAAIFALGLIGAYTHQSSLED